MIQQGNRLVATGSLLLVNCGQILSMRGAAAPRAGRGMGDVGLLARGAVWLRTGRIQAVGLEREVRRALGPERARVLDVKGRVVLPGFVDSHTHALFWGSRVAEYVARLRGATYEEIAQAGGGIQASARCIRGVSERMLAARLAAVLDRFLEHGTTTVEVKSGYGLELAQELKLLRAIRAAAARAPAEVVPTLLAHDVPARVKRRRAGYLEQWCRRLIPLVARARLAEFCDVFCDRGYFSRDETRAILKAAAAAGLRLKLHAEQLAPSGAAVMAAQLGAVSVDHLEHLATTDIRRLRGTGAVATLLPGTVFHLGGGPFPPARRLIAGGVPVALATNFNPGSSPTLNMQMVLALACAQMRMSPEESITAATINGAWALGRGARLGSIEPGKQADLIVMDVRDYREIPYYFGMNLCAAVLKRGRLVYARPGWQTAEPW